MVFPAIRLRHASFEVDGHARSLYVLMRRVCHRIGIWSIRMREGNASYGDRTESMKLQGKRVLLVEDCPDQQRLYLQFLLSAGADVVLECDGYSAVRAARKAARRNEPFDAAIMDLYLTQSDGIRATADIKSEHASLAVIALTANGSPEIEEEWRKAGCCEYLTKPVNMPVLIDTVIRATNAAGQEKSSVATMG